MPAGTVHSVYGGNFHSLHWQCYLSCACACLLTRFWRQPSALQHSICMPAQFEQLAESVRTAAGQHSVSFHTCCRVSHAMLQTVACHAVMACSTACQAVHVGPSTEHDVKRLLSCTCADISASVLHFSPPFSRLSCTKTQQTRPAQSLCWCLTCPCSSLLTWRTSCSPLAAQDGPRE